MLTPLPLHIYIYSWYLSPESARCTICERRWSTVNDCGKRQQRMAVKANLVHPSSNLLLIFGWWQLILNALVIVSINVPKVDDLANLLLWDRSPEITSTTVEGTTVLAHQDNYASKQTEMENYFIKIRSLRTDGLSEIVANGGSNLLIPCLGIHLYSLINMYFSFNTIS